MLPFYSFYYSIYICYYCIYICYETRLMMEMLREKGDNRKYTPPFSASPLSPPPTTRDWKRARRWSAVTELFHLRKSPIQP